MKTITLFFGMILFTGITFCQTLKKGNFVGVHSEDIKLASGVSMDQYIDFVTKKYVPEYQKAFGSKVYITKGVRGENVNKLGMIIIYDSEATRNKYFKDDGTVTEEGTNASKKMDSLNKELEKLGTSSESKYTDWVVQ